MPGIVVQNLGELELLDKMLKDAMSVDENLILKLFRQDVTPDESFDPTSILNLEANFTNYVVQTMTRAGWNAAVTVSGRAESSYGSSAFAWTCGATSNTIYGYWVEGANSGVCLWAQRFDSPRVLADTDVLTVQPKFRLNSEN